ncbi:unnamed protein product [Rotaria sordida]|uniref:DNA-directed RNA polymerase n=1 Tax=Rotaria sordida TaxID=392033 RepID=A0A818UG38_9BILA|nr:unnamed protein product [Rotaria sordida]
MNIHLSQNELTRAEPTELNGTPLTGLIQDHVVAGRILTMRDRFFEKSDYQQLVYNAIGSHSRRKIHLLPPCIWKRKQLWTGKQIISTILLYIQPVNEASLNLDSKSKLSMKSWPSKSNATNIDLMSNTDVIIRHEHLLSRLIDKAHCGSTLASLLHCYYQLYGKRCAADLDLHLELNDVLLLSLGLSHRRRLINQCRAQADSNEQILINEFAKGFCLKSFDERISKEMDINYKISIDHYQNQIVKQSMSNLFKQFQENNLQFLIQSGAKG